MTLETVAMDTPAVRATSVMVTLLWPFTSVTLPFRYRYRNGRVTLVNGQSRVTITDVARTAGVSIATVSKVINGRYGVAVTTSARVQEVIDHLGYESSLVARSLRSARTNVIGILVAEFEPFSTELLKGTSKAIADTGYELLAYSGGGRHGGVGWE